MRILCLLIPHFPVALERRDDPQLQGHPLIVAQDGRVIDGSEEVLAQGVRAGMRMERAGRLCPEAAVRIADVSRYELAFERTLEVLMEASPTVEAEEWGEAYADISRQIARFGDEAALCQETGRKLGREVGLRGKMGISGNKFVSYVAAHAIGPGRALILRPGSERDCLADLPVDLLPLDEELKAELRLLGLRTLGQFARLPRAAVVARFGPEGQRAHVLAQGRGQRPLAAHGWAKWVETARQFEPPLEMDERLAKAVGELAHAGCARLRQQALSCQEVRLALSFEEGSCRVATRTLGRPTVDPVAVEASAQGLLRSLAWDGRITEARLMLGGLQAQQGEQLGLEGIARPTKANLAHLVRPLATRFGADRFYRGERVSPSSPLARARFTWQRWMEGT